MTSKFTIVIITLLSVSCSFSQSLTDSLLMHFPFEGNMNDVGPNGFNGVGNATLTMDRNSVVNEAYYFNGTNSYIDLANNPILKPQLPVSIAMWVKFDNNDPANSAVFTTDFGENTHAGVHISRSATGQLGVNIGDNGNNTSSTTRRSKYGSTILQANVWYHIAVVVNDLTDMEIYINCVNDGGTYSGSGGQLDYTSTPGSIGRKDANMSGPANYFKGSVDEIMYWNRALTTADIDVICEDRLGNESIENPINAITMYPNPASNKLSFSNIPDELNLTYSIIDGQGKIIKSDRLTKSFIDITNLSSGMYYLQLTTDEYTQTRQFVKE